MNFEIKDGVLTKCLSDDCHILIPEGVKATDRSQNGGIALNGKL